MKVTIDAELCNGHGRCYSLSPAVFDSDDEGRGAVTVVELNGALLEAARAAVSNCPERAISIVD